MNTRHLRPIAACLPLLWSLPASVLAVDFMTPPYVTGAYSESETKVNGETTFYVRKVYNRLGYFMPGEEYYYELDNNVVHQEFHENACDPNWKDCHEEYTALEGALVNTSTVHADLAVDVFTETPRPVNGYIGSYFFYPNDCFGFDNTLWRMGLVNRTTVQGILAVIVPVPRYSVADQYFMQFTPY